MGKNALLLSLFLLPISTLKDQAEKVAIIISDRGREKTACYTPSLILVGQRNYH